jgi:hypothetical protein
MEDGLVVGIDQLCEVAEEEAVHLLLIAEGFDPMRGRIRRRGLKPGRSELQQIRIATRP